MIKVAYYKNDQYGNLATEKIAVERAFSLAGSKIYWVIADDHFLFGHAYFSGEGELMWLKIQFLGDCFEIKD